MLSEMFDMFVQSFWETLVMVGISGLVGAAWACRSASCFTLLTATGYWATRRESRRRRASSMPCVRRLGHFACCGHSVHAAGGRGRPLAPWRPSCR